MRLLRPRGVAPEIANLGSLSERTTHEERWNAIKRLSIGAITAKPGHQILRDSQKIEYFKTTDPKLNVHHTKTDSMGVFRDDPAVINVITDENGKIRDVDLWDGHHRMLGALAAGGRTLSELNPANIAIFVNGVDTSGTQTESKPPAAGMDFTQAKRWKRNSNGAKYTPRNNIHHDVLVSGRVSNRELGSVFSLNDLLESNLSRPHLRIGVLFANSELPNDFSSFDALLIVADASSAKRLRNELVTRDVKLPIYVYRGDAQAYIQKFTLESFLKRIQETFVTPDAPVVLPERDNSSH